MIGFYGDGSVQIFFKPGKGIKFGGKTIELVGPPVCIIQIRRVR